MAARTRNIRTPQERAQETVELAQRALERIDAKIAKAKKDIQILDFERETAATRLRYAEQNPDLPKDPEPVLPDYDETRESLEQLVAPKGEDDVLADPAASKAEVTEARVDLSDLAN